MRSLWTHWHFMKHLHLLDLHLRVGGYTKPCFGMLGDVVGEAWTSTVRIGQATKTVDNALLYVVFIKITRCDNRHKVGSIPILVKTLNRSVGEVL